ncbi:MAG TPA: hypothetical protein PLN44_11370 [Syntrophales bacterium]|nr:hypothetical protein [Syntrophales bacterium]HOM08407.1 hypothetical protein [Syntrophales bacterium]HOO00987.1 hypothetical protein [Syntrophales bacterium]
MNFAYSERNNESNANSVPQKINVVKTPMKLYKRNFTVSLAAESTWK